MPVPAPAPVPRTPGPAIPAPAPAEETEVVDVRAALSPSQQVEGRVIRLLANAPVLVSQMQRQMNRRAR